MRSLIGPQALLHGVRIPQEAFRQKSWQIGPTLFNGFVTGLQSRNMGGSIRLVVFSSFGDGSKLPSTDFGQASLSEPEEIGSDDYAVPSEYPACTGKDWTDQTSGVCVPMYW